jgi:hypothetical protein
LAVRTQAVGVKRRHNFCSNNTFNREPRYH